MSPDHFAYWLQGFVELNKGARPTPEQWASIVQHLELVFKKVTPPVGGRDPQKPAKRLSQHTREEIEDLLRPRHPQPGSIYPGRIC